MSFIHLTDIRKNYRLGEVDLAVLRGVSMSIERGELVALMGASGSGKTTLMNLLGCLDRPTSGRFMLDGERVENLSGEELAAVRSRKIGFVFQNFNLLARTSALDNVLMPVTYTPEQPGSRAVIDRARQLLERLGLGDRLDHEPSQLSGGQQQRVAIARSLVNNPSLLLADEPTGALDSKTSAEMLQLFRRLNREEGITIVIVTHDANVARAADRIISIKDGLIVDQEGTPGEHSPAQANQTSSATADAPRRKQRPLVRLFRTLHTAAAALRRNTVRAALTTLGIVIGVAAVIAMMEIGQGASKAVNQTIASMGADNLLIQPGTAASGGVSFGGGSAMTLTPQDAEAVLHNIPAILNAAPVVRVRTQIVYGNRNWVPFFVYGTSPEFLEAREWPVAEGEAFSERDLRNGNKVCLLGQTLVRNLFQGESPIGKEIRVKNVSFRVVGILAPKGANMMGVDQDDVVLAPWTTIKYRVAGTSATTANQSSNSGGGAASGSSSGANTQVNTLSKLYPVDNPLAQLYPQPSATQAANNPQPVRFTNVDQVLVKVRSTEEIPFALREIETLLRERHRIRAGQASDFNIRDMTESAKALSQTSDLMAGLLLSVALISLVVGGVGIMNIMLVSVTERTREIGLRMAVGASPGDILRQFLVEAVVLCLLGGAMGILLGWGTSALVRIVFEWPTETSIPAVIAAVAVSAAVGIVFGFYPAWKASRLDPIEALRYE